MIRKILKLAVLLIVVTSCSQGDFSRVSVPYNCETTLGDSEAQFNTGNMYYHGRGLPQNDNKAIQCYRLAVKQGHAKAQYKLGLMYQNGLGVSQDSKEALKLYRLAAGQGNVASQERLGWIYNSGIGAPKDYVSARMWYGIAALHGAENKFSLILLEEKMSQKQIFEAKRRVATWIPTPSEKVKAVQSSSASPTTQTPTSKFPINELPMYGNIHKSDAQKKADADFIARIERLGHTRDSVSKKSVKRGWESFEKNDVSTAMKRFNQAWLLNSENGDAYHGFAVVTARRGGNSKEIESLFRLALSKPGVTVAAHVDYGRFLWTQKRYDESLERLHTALGINPQAYLASAHISFVHYKRREFKMACKWGKRAEKNNDKLEPDYLKHVCGQKYRIETRLPIADYDARLLCIIALFRNNDTVEWGTSHWGRSRSTVNEAVDEAKSRGYSLSDCRWHAGYGP